MTEKEQQVVWDLHEQTRQGKNICPHCNKPKKMYYQPWCPRCEKPQPETLTCLNFLQCMYHLEAIGHTGIKKRLWEHLCEYDMKGNDSYMKVYFPTEEKMNDSEEYNEEMREVNKDLKIWAETFNLKLGECHLFWVSW